MNTIDAVTQCEVDIETGVITITGDEGSKPDITELLLKPGYPESGTAEGLKAAKAKVKTFVSCAVGKMNGWFSGNVLPRLKPAKPAFLYLVTVRSNYFVIPFAANENP